MENKYWWDNYPWRLIQTNLREKDMENIDATKYVEDLKKLNATVVMINACGISANYETKTEGTVTNPYLKGSSLKEIVDECHKNGIKVIARNDFSKIKYEVYEKHKDWAFIKADGNIVNYNGHVSVCQNSFYSKEVKYEMLKEMFELIPFDGLYCNMTTAFNVDYDYVFHGFCYCDECKKAYREMFNEDMPVVSDQKDPRLFKIMKFQNICSARNKEKLKRFVKSINENIAVNGVDYQREEAGSDIGVRRWQYAASSNARLASRMYKDRVSDGTSTDFFGFRYRHCSMSPYQIELRLWQSLANAGTVSVYLMGRLDNRADVSSYSHIGKVFAFHKEHEDLFTNIKSDSDTLLIRRPGVGREDPEGYGLIRILTESHIPFDEINLSDLSPESFINKKNVIIGDAKQIPPEKIALLDEFVNNGGKLIATGDTSSLACLGIANVREKRKNVMSDILETNEAFENCKKAPLIPFGNEMLVCEYKEEVKSLCNLIPTHPWGPPEICYYDDKRVKYGAAMNNYGKGTAIHLPYKLGSFYYNEGLANTLDFFKDIFAIIGIKPLSDCTEMVEFTKMKANGKTFIQCINTSGCFINSFVKPLPINNINIYIDGLENKKATALNGGEVKVLKDRIVLNTLNEYEAIVIE